MFIRLNKVRYLRKFFWNIVVVGSLNVYMVANAAEKAAFVYIGPIGDQGWTYSHNQGRIKAEKLLDGKFTTSYLENIPETADAERVFRNLAQQGNKVIFGTSFGYMNQIQKVAKQFPNTIFMHATGYKTDKNLGTYTIRYYEGAYLLGVIAGAKTKSNILGVVAAYPVPEVINNINAFTLGAQSVNPKIKTKVIWVNSWFNPGKERDAALTLISQGVDVLLQNTDSPAVMQAAQQKGIYSFGWYSDKSKFGPKAQLAASVVHWEKIYTQVLNNVEKKTWKPTKIQWGMAQNAIQIENFNSDVPIDIRNRVAKISTLIKEGKMHPFDGPIYSQSGSLIVNKGKYLNENAISKMNYYVKGIDGILPK